MDTYTNSIRLLAMLLFVAICFAKTSVIAQVVTTESFDNATFPPTGWTTIGDDSASITRVIAGTHPTQTPNSGAGEVEWNSYSISSGSSALVTPVIDWGGRGGNTPTVSFWFYRDGANYNTPTYDVEGVNILVNTIADTTGATNLGFIPRRIGETPIVPSTGWYQYTFNIPAGFNLSVNYIIFNFVSADGDNCFLDDVQYDAYTSPPCTAPVSQATGLNFSNVATTELAGSFTAAADSPDGYLVVRSTVDTLSADPVSGTSYSPGTALGGGTVVKSDALTTFNDAGLAGGTTYFYFIFSYNSANCSAGPAYFTTGPLTGDTVTCNTAVPTALIANSVNANSFIANWDSVQGAIGYQLDVSTDSAFSTFVSGYNNLALNDTFISVTGLLPLTTYYYRVRTVGTCVSSNSNIVVASTPCVALALNVFEGFNSTTIPGCWNQQYVVGTDDIQFTDASNHPATTPEEGSDYVWYNSYSISDGDQTRLVSPPIITTGTASVEVQFYWNAENNDSYNTGLYATAEGMQVQYSIDGITWLDAGSFVTRNDSNLAVGTSQWEQKNITLPAGAGNQPAIYVGFLFQSQFGDNCSMDSVLVQPSSAICPTPGTQPTTLNFSAVTSDTIAGSFTAAADAPDGYLVVRSTTDTLSADPVNGTIYTPGSALGGGTVVKSNASTTFIDGGLMGTTRYYYFIFSYNSVSCGAGPSYLTSGPLTGDTITCIAIPTAIAAIAVSSNDFTAEWDSVPGATGYQLDISTDSTFSSFISGYNNLAVSDTSVSVTGLSINTTYYYRVRTSGGCDSSNSNIISVTTSCTAVPLNVFEGFNNGVLPSCWSQQYVTGTDDIQFVTSSSHPTTSAQEGSDYVWYNSYSISDGDQTRLVSLPINTTGTGGVDVRFYWYAENNSSYNSGLYATAEGMQVQYSTDGTTWLDAGSFVTRNDSSLADGTGLWEQKNISLPAGAGNQPVIYVGFLFQSQFGDNCSMDSVFVHPSPPLCATPGTQPTALIFTSVASASITGSFTAAADAPDGYLVVRSTANSLSSNPVDGTVYGPGTALGGGTVVQSNASTTFNDATLTAGTMYFYFIFSYNSLNCSAGPSYLSTGPLTGDTITCSTAVPIAYTADSVTAYSFIAKWDSIPAGASYQLDVSTDSAFATYVSGYNSLAVTDTTVSVTGLSQNTTYYYRVKAVGACNSSYSNVIAVTTPCAPVPLNVFEGFNSTVIPGCWNQQYVIGTDDIEFTDASNHPTTVPEEGSDYVWYNSYSITDGDQTRLVSLPIITTGTASVDVQFNWYAENNTNYNSGLYATAEGMQVQYSTDGITWLDAGSFVTRNDGSLADGTGQWEQKNITLPAGAGNQPYMYVGFLFQSQFGDNCSMDSIWIHPSLPVCAAPAAQPTALNFNPVTSTSIAGSFTAVSADAYLVVRSATNNLSAGPVNGTIYSPGTPLGGGTVVQSNGSTTFTDTGLTASTRYYYFVFSYNSINCSAGPAYFTTNPLTGDTVTCIAIPNATAATTLRENSFTANWDSVPGATGYRLDVSTDSIFGSYISGYSNLAVSNTSSLVTGLSPGITYYYRVRTVGNCNSSNSNVIATSTLCIPVPLSVFEGFNGGTIPSCWHQQYVVGTNDIAFVDSSIYPTTTPEEGSDYVFFNSYNITAGEKTRLVSPQINTTGTANVNVQFYWFAENSTSYAGAEGVQVQYSTDGGNTWVDAGSLVSRYDSTLASGTGQWEQKIIALPSGAGNQPVISVGFLFQSQYGDNCSMDSVLIHPGCNTPPTVSINSTDTTVCAGASLILTTSASNQGIAPQYEWEVNGTTSASNADTLILNNTSNGIDTVNVILTSGVACPNFVPVTSAPVIVSVLPLVTPTATITVNPNDTVCAADLQTFTAVVTYSGTAPFYQWVVNNSNAGPDSNSFIPSGLNSGDSVKVVVTSNAMCSASTATSNTIAVDIYPTPATPVITAVGTDSITCSTSGDTYQWLLGNAPTAYNTQTIKPAQSGSYKAIVTTNGCSSDTSLAYAFVLNGINGIDADLINVYPNPTNGALVIEGSSPIESVQVYDYTGKLLYEKLDIKSNKLLIDLSNTADGILNILIESKNLKVVKRIVVAH